MLPGSSESSLEKQFALLEGASAVDAELAKMKALLAGSKDSTSISASKPSNPAVDDELEKEKEKECCIISDFTL